MSILNKLLKNTNSRYLAFSLVTYTSIVLLLCSCLLIVPLVLLINLTPFSGWLPVVLKVFWVGGALAMAASLVSLLFCYLVTKKLNKYLSALLFGLSVPSLFLVTISISLWLSKGAVLHGLDTPEGLNNLLFTYILFGGLGFYLFLSTSKKIPAIAEERR